MGWTLRSFGPGRRQQQQKLAQRSRTAAAIKSCDSRRPGPGPASSDQENGPDSFDAHRVMVSSLSQAEVLIALVVAAHAGVLAIRLAVSLYKA